MKRSALILTGFWAVLISPSLCVAGLLKHPCEPHPSSDCSHEPGCAEDPCGQLIKPQENSHSSVVLPVVSSFWFIVTIELPPRAELHSSGPTEPPRGLHLPFPPSDVPLRV